MSVPEIIKPGFDKQSRGVLHHLMTPSLPFMPEPEIRSEILGGVTVVGLSGGILLLMRILLAN